MGSLAGHNRPNITHHAICQPHNFGMRLSFGCPFSIPSPNPILCCSLPRPQEKEYVQPLVNIIYHNINTSNQTHLPSILRPHMLHLLICISRNITTHHLNNSLFALTLHQKLDLPTHILLPPVLYVSMAQRSPWLLQRPCLHLCQQ